MKRIVFSVFALGLLVLGLISVVPSFPPQMRLQPVVRAAATEDTVNLEVACDCRTFKHNRGVPWDQTTRADGFITNGKIFPAGTLRPGTQNNDPNDPVGGVKNIGSWVCRGTGAYDSAEANAGAPPPLIFYTQYHMLSDGRTLISEGFDASPLVARSAVLGGMGAFAGARGEALAEIIGTNVTGCPNIRFTFNLKKDPANYPGWQQ